MGTAAQDHNVADHAKPIEVDKMLCRLWESPSQLKQELEKDVRMSGGLGCAVWGVGLRTGVVIVESLVGRVLVLEFHYVFEIRSASI